MVPLHELREREREAASSDHIFKNASPYVPAFLLAVSQPAFILLMLNYCSWAYGCFSCSAAGFFAPDNTKEMMMANATISTHSSTLASCFVRLGGFPFPTLLQGPSLSVKDYCVFDTYNRAQIETFHLGGSIGVELCVFGFLFECIWRVLEGFFQF